MKTNLEIDTAQSAVHKSPKLQCASWRALWIATLLNSAICIGGPQGGSVVNGSAAIRSPNADVTNINQTSNRAVIDWRSFSVAPAEVVNFNQPSSMSATLNRVLGGQESVISGALHANGQVYLLNSSGVLFTKGATVDVGGLLATTSNISVGDFMSGRLSFTPGAQPSAAVTNQGMISIRDGGFAALVAPSVRNEGVISARLGKVALGGGETFTLDLYGDQLINFAVPSHANSARAVEQSGSVIADSGRVLLTTDAAAGVVGGVVNMSGVVQVRSVQQLPSGEIILSGSNTAISVGGTLDTSGKTEGARGGAIHISGESVTLANTALLDASGYTGGGEIRIGGGGTDPGMPSARNVSTDRGAILDVSALVNGNGGTASIWSTDSTRFSGLVHTRGGAREGDGGRADVSSAGLVTFRGELDGSAVGRGSTLILDPRDIVIQPIGTDDLSSSTISGSAVRTLLRQGVTVALLADNSITVDDFLDGRPLPGQSQTTVSGAVDLQAGTIVLRQPIVSNNSPISLVATSGGIQFQNNSYAAVANTAAAVGIGTADINISATGDVIANQLVSLGRISVTSTGGDIKLQQALNGFQSASGPTGIGDLSLIAKGGISVVGTFSHGNVSFAAGRGIDTSGPVIADGAIDLSSSGPSGDIKIGSVGAATNAALDAGRGVSLETGGNVSMSGSILARGGDIQIGTDEARVASVSMDGGTALQSVESVGAAKQDGKISISSAGSQSLQDLIAGTGGAVVLDGLSNVTLNKGLFGLDNNGVPSGIGSLNIISNGNVASMGVKSAGVIDVESSGGAVHNSAASLISTAGGVTLSGNSILLDSVGTTSNPAADIDAMGAVNLAGKNGSIAVLSTIRAGSSLTAIASSDIQTNGVQAGDAISVTSGGGFTNTGHSLSSDTGSINLNANFIELGANQAGANLPVAAMQAAGNIVLTSTGSVEIDDSISSTNGVLDIQTHGGSIAITGARTNGAISLVSTGGGALQNTGVALDAGGDITLASTGPVSLEADTRSRGGSINIGSNAQRVGTLTLTGGLQAVDATSFQTGNVSIYTTGSVSAADLIVGSQGAVTIDSQGTVTLKKALAGLCASGVPVCSQSDGGLGIGSLMITSAGDIAAVGAKVAGDIVLSSTQGGAISNSDSVLIGKNVTLQTSGPVVLHSDVLATAGPIDIGSVNQRVASATLAGDLQASAATANSMDGNISIYSAGPVSANRLITGTVGTVQVDSNGPVNLNQALSGLCPSGSSVCSTTAEGIGALTVVSNDTVTLHGAKVRGDINVIGGGPIANLGGQLDAGGDITIRTPSAVTFDADASAGGNIQIGSDTQSVAAFNSPGTMQAGGGSGGISVRSSGSIDVGNLVAGNHGTVTLSGSDVTVDGTINDSETGLSGVGEVSIFATNTATVHGIRVSGSVQDISVPAEVSGDSTTASLAIITGATGPNGSSGGSVAILGPIVSGGPIFIGQTAPYVAGTYIVENGQHVGVTTPSAQINFSDGIKTTGKSVVFNGDVTLFKGITFWDIECVVYSLCIPGAVPADLDAKTFSEADYQGAGSIGIFHFAKLDLLGVDARGEPLPLANFNDQNDSRERANGAGCVSSFYCGAAEGESVGDYRVIPQNFPRLAQIMGTLNAQVDTTDGSHPGGANVTVTGNLDRFRGAAPVLAADSPCAAQLCLLPSYVTTTLSIKSGSTGAITLTGHVGDDTTRTDLASEYTVVIPISPSPVLFYSPFDPLTDNQLGKFIVNMTADNGKTHIHVANLPSLYFSYEDTSVCDGGGGSCTDVAGDKRSPGYYVNGLAPDLAWVGMYMTFNNRTSPADGTLGELPPSASTLGNPIFQPAPGAGSAGVGSLLPGGTSLVGITSLGTGGTEAGAAGLGATGLTSLGLTGFTTAPPVEGTTPANSGNTTLVLPTTAESTVHQDEVLSVAADTSGQTMVTANDSCPRGSGQLADLGLSPAINGAAPDVFARCRGR